MNGQDLIIKREEIIKSLNTSMQKMHQNGIEFAEATREYRMKLAQTILILKNKGVQITILEKVAKGQEDVADLELKMMTAEVLYRSSQENIMIQKKLLDSIEDDIKREWSGAKL